MDPRPRWQPHEIAILRTIYAEQGLAAAMKALPGRHRQAIFVKASKLGIKCIGQQFRVGWYVQHSEEAWHLRHEDKLSFVEIGRRLGVCEAQATNSVLYAECIKAGHTPLERHAGGRLRPEGRDRLRLMFRKGWTHRKIQEWTGCPAATLTRERKLYAAELKAKGLAPLPPIGGGLRYSGAKIPKALARRVEQLYLEGYGTKTVVTMTGVSNTHSLRTRTKLVLRLRRKGQCLPGCDIDGVRRIFKDHMRHVPQVSIDQLTQLLKSGRHSVNESARLAGVGSCFAYRFYHANKERLALPPLRGWGRKSQVAPFPGKGQWGFIRYRQLLREGRTPAEARTAVFAEHRALQEAELIERQAERDRILAEHRRPKSLDEQIALIEQGRASLYTERPMLPVQPLFSGAGSSLG
jgi:hypothetical protein